MNIYNNSSIADLERKNNKVLANSVVVFIEKIHKSDNKDNKSGYYLLMDFPTNISYKINFSERTDFNIIEGKSMLEINNVNFEKGGIPREGHFYYLPDVLIEGYNWNSDIRDNNLPTSFVALTSEGFNKKVNFEVALNYKNLIQDVVAVSNEIWSNNVQPLLKGVDSSNINVYAYNVGQGNWNEILFNNKFLIVYDLGSSSHEVFLETYNRVIPVQSRIAKINSIVQDGFNFKKILIISHWDIDHYNGIFALSEEIVKSFEFCIVPNKIENDTTFRAFEKLLKLTTVYPIEMNAKGTGIGATSRLTEIYKSELLNIFKGTKCSDRNKRGLLLSIHSKQVDFIFPGDHHYNQIDKYLIPYCKGNELNLIVPHHGGHAGKNSLMDKWPNGNDSIISSGGKHGHPFKHIEDACDTNFTDVYRTDAPLDYYKSI